ncbi:MAG: hypothetical protein ACYTHM_12935 [Planctomycetota bacterium]|jgi:hypothetical protein
MADFLVPEEPERNGPHAGPTKYPQETESSGEELLAAGWERRFVTEEPRLSESIELYLSLGYEVRLRRLTEADMSQEDCSACFQADPSAFRVIYTRK